MIVKTKGDCECCIKSIDVDLTVIDGMAMCDKCKTDHLTAKSNTMIENSRKIDSSIELKADVFLAQTVPAVELRAAIQNDPSIADDQKEYTFAKIAMERFETLQKAIFEERKSLLEKENEMRMWQVNVQTSAGKLRSELRAEFSKLAVDYNPAPITKKQKSTKPVKSGKAGFSGADKTELFDAAKKFDVPAAQVRAIMLSNHGWSAAKAAEYLHGLLNPK